MLGLIQVSQQSDETRFSPGVLYVRNFLIDGTILFVHPLVESDREFDILDKYFELKHYKYVLSIKNNTLH